MNPERTGLQPNSAGLVCNRDFTSPEGYLESERGSLADDIVRANALRIARGIARAKTVRETRLPSRLFSDPGWDMLIELFIADATGRRLSVTDVCSVRGIPASTGQRYLRRMAGAGLVVRTVDPRDRRRTFLDLPSEASEMLAALLTRMASAFAGDT